MDALWVELLKLVGSVVGLATAGLWAYCRIREKRITKEQGLADNPERCGQHEEAISTLKSRVEKLDESNDKAHDEMFRQLGAMCIELAKLGRNGGGGK